MEDNEKRFDEKTAAEMTEDLQHWQRDWRSPVTPRPRTIRSVRCVGLGTRQTADRWEMSRGLLTEDRLIEELAVSIYSGTDFDRAVVGQREHV